jgi:hypothetical protein
MMPVLTLDDLLSLADEIEQNEQTSIQNEAPGSEDAEERGFDEEEVVLLSRIGQALSEAMSNELSEMDLNDELSDEEHQEIMFTIFDKVLKAVKKKGNKDLDEADLAFVKARIEKEAIKRNLQQPHATKRRFAPLDRVVCRVRGDREWAAGTVQALDQENDDVDPYRTFPYLVKVDPPGSSGVLVPEDTNNEVRAEMCFGQRTDGLLWTLRCLPRTKARGSHHKRRFVVGERVACAVESDDGNLFAPDNGYTDWAAGTVIAVDHPVEGMGAMPGGIVPYRVAMDSGATVLVHQDEHWLIRDLTLQPTGPRVSADGTRELTRMGTCKLRDGLWHVVDHVTRNVRKLEQEVEQCDVD